MRKVYSFGARWDRRDVEFLSSLGIKVEPTVKTFELYDDNVYNIVKQYLGDRKVVEVTAYDYDKEDILESEYCVLDGHHCCGYPEPSDGFRYCEVSYDINRMCPKCGMDMVQTADMRVSKVSKHRLWSYFAWVNDVLFVTKEFYGEVFEPLGLKCRPVRTVSGKIREGTVQLVLPVIDEPLDMVEGSEYETCDVCGKKKYHYLQPYPFFPLHERPLPYLYLSREYFGSGAQANKRIFFSTELARKLIAMKELKYYWLIPCKRNLCEYLKTIKY